MEILVTEAIAGAARSAAEQLEAAGHRVHRCHAESSAPFPCAGLVSECPLEARAIDLVLAVRPHVRTSPAPTEDGIACGLRRHIPVAVAGQTLMNPFEQFGAESIEGDLVAACGRIALSARPEHEAAAVAATLDTLSVEGAPKDPPAASVQRIDGRLRVRVYVPAEVPDRTRQIIAVRVVGRLRELDPNAAGIDVGVATIEAER